MPNTFFRFRQFVVHQEKATMKVCTDACLFGAWVASRGTALAPRAVLDIGTGTGLLSLMVAQKINAVIHALDVERGAFLQARDNFAASPWTDRLKIFFGPVQTFEPPNSLYDLVISNPPFYHNDLKSPDDGRNIALHGTALSFEELLSGARTFLHEQGFFAVLLPYEKAAGFLELAHKKGFYLLE